MKRWLGIYAAFFCLFFALLSAMAEVSSYVKLDKTTVSIDDTITMQIVVTGSITAMPSLNLDSDAFTIVSSSNSSNQTIINGQYSSESVFSYILLPKKIGKFLVGEAVIKVNGQQIKTKASPVIVYKSNSNSANNSGTSANSYSSSTILQNSGVNVVPNNQTYSDANEILFSAKVNKTNPYINEQLVYTATLYYRMNIDQINVTPPGFKDFIYEQQEQKQPYKATINGVEYMAYDFSYILFPTKAGQIIIPASILSARFIDNSDPFSYLFSTSNSQNAKLKTAPLSIYVKNWPSAPKNYINAVGRFHIKSETDKKVLKAGETLGLTVTVWGSGNLKSLTIAETTLLENFKKDFKIYPYKPTQDISYKDDSVYGQKVFKYDLVPLKTGVYSIPSIDLTYFDPRLVKYKNIKTEERTFQVISGSVDLISNQGSNVSSQVRDKFDIIPIHTKDNIFNEPIKYYYYWIFIILTIVPYIIIFILTDYIRKKYNEMEKTPYHRQKMAYKIAKQYLFKLKKQKPFTDNILSLIIKCFKQYLTDKLDLSVNGFTATEIKDLLQSKSIQNSIIDEIDYILSSCEHIAYCKDNKTSISPDKIYEKSLKILPKLDKELKKCS